MSLIDGIDNYNVMNALLKAQAVIPRYLHVAVSISGGSDSDIMLDIVEKVKGNTKVTYFSIDCGLEYQATKDHLDYLENRYNIKIERIKSVKSIPTCIREKGIPFVSKFASTRIGELYKAGFDFMSGETLEDDLVKYPKYKAAIKYWHNAGANGAMKMFDIRQNKYLKEFMTENPPDFPISSYCCDGSKKRTARRILKELDADLECLGLRKAEGGIRSVAYTSCWDENHPSGLDKFRPIFWLTNEDKRYYEQRFGIVHSRCYTEWGLKRTGCVGCPFGRGILEELEIIQKYEPKMYKACMNIFGKSYEYTKKYRAFAAEMKARERAGDQLLLTELAERIANE